jgi:hypothetical protein
VKKTQRQFAANSQRLPDSERWLKDWLLQVSPGRRGAVGVIKAEIGQRVVTAVTGLQFRL